MSDQNKVRLNPIFIERFVAKYIGEIELNAVKIPLEFEKIDFYYQHSLLGHILDKVGHNIEIALKISEYFDEREIEIVKSLGIDYKCESCCH